jgi:coenzyme Q-binding protein COQ10
VYCVPNRVVEAVAGQAKTDLSNEELQHYKGISGMGVGIPGQRTDVLEGGDVFKALRTRWELTEAEVDGKQGSNVDLQIEFEFNNPLYAAVSGAAVPKVAGVVVSAFEKRARAVLGQE